jgi:hypothetical protein
MCLGSEEIHVGGLNNNYKSCIKIGYLFNYLGFSVSCIQVNDADNNLHNFQHLAGKMKIIPFKRLRKDTVLKTMALAVLLVLSGSEI